MIMSVQKVLVNVKNHSSESKSRVCSNHFDGEFDYPTKDLGYIGVDKKLNRMFTGKFSKR